MGVFLRGLAALILGYAAGRFGLFVVFMITGDD